MTDILSKPEKKETQEQSVLKKNRNEICWNLINSGIAGALVLAGSLTDGEISLRGFVIALGAAIAVFLTKFKDYWTTEKGEYASKIFKFF